MRAHRGPSPLRLCHDVRRALLEHLGGDPHRERCGLLGGNPDTARHFYPVANVSPQPAQRYEMDPAQQIAAMKRMRDRGEQLVAIAHSHPDSAAEPSATDIAQASYPDTVYLIVSLVDAGRPEMKGFRLHPGRVPEAVELQLL